MRLEVALGKARNLLSNYEKNNHLELISSNIFKMTNRLYRVENLTNDGRIGFILVFQVDYRNDESWTIWYLRKPDILALNLLLNLLDLRIKYNKCPIIRYEKRYTLKNIDINELKLDRCF